MAEKSEGGCNCQVDALVTIDGRGQIVLPKEVREKAYIKEGDKGVGPLEPVRRKKRSQGNKGTNDEAEISERNPDNLGNNRKGRTVTVEKHADIAERSFKDGLGVVSEKEMSNGEDRKRHHPDPREKAEDPGPPHSIQC